MNVMKDLYEIILDELENNKRISDEKVVYEIDGLEKFSIPENEKIFYKFIIPRDIKVEVLKQLYTDGYSEERLFPGYAGVTKYIKNKAKLDELLDK